MNTRPLVAGATRVVGAASGEAAAGVAAKRAGNEALETGAKRSAQELLESAGDAALRRAPAAAPTDPVAALRRGPQGFLNAEHRAASETLDGLLSQQRQLRPGTPEFIGLEGNIRETQRSIAVYTTRQQIDLAQAAAGTVNGQTRESAARELYQTLARAQRDHGEALVAAGRPQEASAAFRAAGRAFKQASSRDLTEHGRAWVADVNSAVLMAGRAGDAQGAVDALRGLGGHANQALALLRQAHNLPPARDLERRNSEAVARALIDDLRSRPFSTPERMFPVRAPLTDRQFADIAERARSRALADDVVNHVIGMN